MTTILLLAISSIALIIVTIKLLASAKMTGKLNAEIEQLRQGKASAEINCEQAKNELLRAVKEVSDLSQFKEIVNVELHIKNEKTKAEADIQVLKERSAAQISNKEKAIYLLTTKAEQDATQIVAKAKDAAKTLEDRTNRITADANSNAKTIIDTAKEEAKKIAASALDALNNAELYEKTATAMKNIIEGYGDKYIVPSHGLLDNLADDYSHTQAGEELKRARARTRGMITNETAAECEYVEANRRETAINFVLDAFNGKVDTILATVKEGNIGTLEQKIRDAFQTVNFNGRAFREARITDIYLATRLDELKWACTVQAIKERDKEEQRRIREQIREEEKATRDYERAIKEAQKEEESLSKAMDKVRKDLESASEQQRLKYEERLLDLQNKLKETEERNQRAISLAQQTRTGHVYIISNIGSFGEDVVKIGMTRRLDPQDRIDELGDASVPFDFDVHAMLLSEDAPTLEKELHRRFSEMQINRVNSRKEFFKLNMTQIKTEIEQMGINAHWTMTAEAKEYRESLAILKNGKKATAA